MPSPSSLSLASEAAPTLRNVVDLTIPSPQLDRDVRVQVYPPFGIYRQRQSRMPVIYAQDGQHVFDTFRQRPAWGAGRTLDEWATAGGGALLVAVENGGATRTEDYCPFVDERFGGGNADAYVSFLTETLKPEIDRLFPTYVEPERTAILGSSLGAILSVYAHFRRPDVFGLVGALSPSVSFADHALSRFVHSQRWTGGRVYLAAGTHEFGTVADGSPSQNSREYLRRVRKLRDEFVALGFSENETLTYHEFIGGKHSEPSWGERLPSMIRELFSAKSHCTAIAS